jgi:hypothetical protein
MSSRAASATSSRRAKQELVRILFGSKYKGKGPDAHQILDHSIYSYSKLRCAYLERIQMLHPDKKCTQNQLVLLKDREDARDQFVQLKEAWNRYEDLAKMMKRVEKGDEMEASFTRFGVGCSFADSEAERAQRIEIMDQAGRGWFSAGSLGAGSRDEDCRESCEEPKAHRVSLLHDDDFMSHDDDQNLSEHRDVKESRNTDFDIKRKFLFVKHLIRPSLR